ncbi:MAG: translation initiation factor IF-2 [Candidatus Omnitrophota bacterium]
MPKTKKEKTPVKKTAAVKKKLVVKSAARPAAVKKTAAKIAVKPPKIKKRIVPAHKPTAVIHESVITPVVKPVVHELPKVKLEPAIHKAPVKEERPTVAHPPVHHLKTEEKHKVVKKEEHKPVQPAAVIEKPLPIVPAKEYKTLELKLPITVKDLSVKLQEKSSILIKQLMSLGSMAGINQILPEEIVVKICEKYGFKITQAPDQEELTLRIHDEKDKPETLQLRAPIVTLMGHVDHGKTSLLDAIRKTKVAEGEHGGITQHIGAYRVILPGGEITFLDTPGHEAFTAMRARGASITDIVVLVVAADDGVMPQTQEAIDHANAAGVPIIVAMNKIDKPQANLDMVKKQLAKAGLNPEDWGGKTITVPVSAKSQEGIDNLLEMILLQAQIMELKANPKRLAKGVVVEAKLSKGRGPVVTLLVQNGTLRLDENIIVGKYYGKIRAMFNDRAQAVTEVRPSFPVEILGLSGVPDAGEQFFAIEDEKEARDLAISRQEKERQQDIKIVKRVNLEGLYAQIQAGKLKELKLVVKADMQGSLEAIKDILNKLNTSAEIKLTIIHEGVGSINSSDVILAVASDALIIGFNVTADERAKEIANKEGVEVRVYNIIYELGNEIRAAMEGMLEPKLKKVFLGKVEIRQVFKLSRSGTIAGCFVTKGKVMRSSLITVVRNGAEVFEGKISSLKRFKDDVREVAEDFECGIAIAGFDDYKPGDVLEVYEIEKIARTL